MNEISSIVQQMRGPIETTPQETVDQSKTGTLTSGRDVSRAMRDSMTGQNSLEVAAGKDSVHISEEGRSMQKRMADEKAEEKTPGQGDSSVDANQASAGGADAANAGEQALQDIRKQIRELEKQISQLEQTISQKSGGTPKNSGTAQQAEAAEAPAVDGETASAGNAASAGVPGNGSGENPEIDTMESQLQAMELQLMQLNQRLMEESQSKGGQVVTGTAGIGGEANGPSGQGERISVTA